MQHTIASFNMYVGLPHQFKGTHMSRFVEILERARARDHGRDLPGDAAARWWSKLEAEEGRIEMTFPYFIDKAAPVSGVQSLMDYEVTFIGADPARASSASP